MAAVKAGRPKGAPKGDPKATPKASTKPAPRSPSKSGPAGAASLGSNGTDKRGPKAAKPGPNAAKLGAKPGKRSQELAELRSQVADLRVAEAERVEQGRIEASLLKIAETATAVRDLTEFYAAIHSIVADLMYAENFYIALYDDETNRINFPFYVDTVDTVLPDPAVWAALGTEDAGGVTGYVLRTGVPLYLTEDRWQAMLSNGEISYLGAPAVSWLGVPLRSGGRTLGVIAVQSYREDRRHSERDLEVLTFVAQHIASALERTRAIDETRQRNAELALVNEVGRALAEQLEFEAVVELVGERVRGIFESDSLAIVLYDAATQMLSAPYLIDAGERLEEPPWPFGTGLMSTVIRTREPLLLGSSEASEAQGAIFIGGVDNESWLGVPILAGDQVIGVINLENQARDAYDEADDRLLATLASSMGVALENARLFDETKRLLAETDQRAAELAVVNEIGLALAKQLDFQSIIELVGERVRTILVRVDAVHRHPRPRHEPHQVPLLDRRRCPGLLDAGRCRSGRGSTSIVIRIGPAASARDAPRRPTRSAPTGPVPRTESYLGVPIWAGERVLGVIAVASAAAGGLQRGRRAPADDPLVEHGRRARERAPVRRDASAAGRDRPAGRRAGDHHERPGGPGGRARHAGDVRPGRRQDPRDLRGNVDLHRDPRQSRRA